MDRYLMICNGLGFDCPEHSLLDYLDTLNPMKRIVIRKGINGEDFSFETVSEALVHFSREFHNEYARSQHAELST